MSKLEQTKVMQRLGFIESALHNEGHWLLTESRRIWNAPERQLDDQARRDIILKYESAASYMLGTGKKLDELMYFLGQTHFLKIPPAKYLQEIRTALVWSRKRMLEALNLVYKHCEESLTSDPFIKKNTKWIRRSLRYERDIKEVMGHIKKLVEENKV